MTSAANICPICNNDNKCGNISETAQESCWCSHEFFSEELLAKIPAEQLGKSCVCKNCLKA